ncbi:MAG: tRNA (N(6)-L-threonylcarbamoyladenosine(37)-C(2))-methylthiotransferase MtaB [Syntrophomonadaceae bacterium]
MNKCITIAFHTLGCKVNQVETEQMMEKFQLQGYQVVDFGDPADIYIINTCTVTHISDRKSRALLRRAVRNNPGAMVVATGCAAELAREQLAEIEGLGLIVGNQGKDSIVELVENLLGKRPGGPSDCELQCAHPRQMMPVLFAGPHERTRGFIKIQDGCQSFCSYCIVPFARGPLQSKSPVDVQAEFRHMLNLGYREIVLTGIHTGMYGADLTDWDLTGLVESLLVSNKGEFRIRLSSIEPGEWHDDLLDLIATESRICRHFHIPLQSGSDRILASMRRGYNREQYRQLLSRIARLIPGAVFTADVMVGYPTETEADFQDTYNLLAELPVLELHVFKYSPRAGTIAAGMQPQVEARVKQARSQMLLQLSQQKKRNYLRGLVGQEVTVLVERRLYDNFYAGLSDDYVEVRMASEIDLVGKLVKVLVTTAEDEYVRGTPSTLAGPAI